MASCQPGAPSAPSATAEASLSRGNNPTVALPLAECLHPWFDVFEKCSTMWGLITDARDDGTTYKRHGIIVELTADITAAVEASQDAVQAALRRVRRGVDFVKLVLAVDPQVLLPLLLRRKDSVPDLGKNPELHEDELKELTCGDAPFELRLYLDIESKNADGIQDTLVERLMRKLDEEDVDTSPGSPAALRRYLVERVHSSAAARRLVHCPVQTVIRALPSSSTGLDVVMMSETASDDFIKKWTPATHALYLYQDWRDYKWDLAKNLAPLVVEKIQLDLSGVPLTKNVVGSIMGMANKGIQVSSSAVCLDVRHEFCDEPELQAFLNEMVQGIEGPLTIFTGPVTYQELQPADANDEDFSEKILMFLRCIGQVDHHVKLLIGSFFMGCRARRNREAFFQGFFESVLSREQATSVYFSHTDADAEDTELFQEASRNWRGTFPDKKICLRDLDWLPKDHGIEFIRAFLREISDVESIAIFPASEIFHAHDVVRMFQFPSVRSLYIELVELPTMDIFDSSTPALHSLELSGVGILDPSSLIRFIERLNPRSASPIPLSTSLRVLGISEANAQRPVDLAVHPMTRRFFGFPRRTRIHPGEDTDQSYIRRAVNDPNAVTALEDVLTVNTVLEHVSFLGNFANIGPKHLEWGSSEKPPTKSRIAASAEAQRTGIVKAQNAAFLSSIQDGNCAPLRLLDSNVAKLILAFSAPHAFRHIHV